MDPGEGEQHVQSKGVKRRDGGGGGTTSTSAMLVISGDEGEAPARDLSSQGAVFPPMRNIQKQK